MPVHAVCQHAKQCPRPVGERDRVRGKSAPAAALVLASVSRRGNWDCSNRVLYRCSRELAPALRSASQPGAPRAGPIRSGPRGHLRHSPRLLSAPACPRNPPRRQGAVPCTQASGSDRMPAVRMRAYSATVNRRRCAVTGVSIAVARLLPLSFPTPPACSTIAYQGYLPSGISLPSVSSFYPYDEP